MELFEIGGSEYYLDLNMISDFVRIDEEKPRNLEELFNKEEDNKETEEDMAQGPLLDMTKWELVRVMIETIINENGIIDEDMGPTMLGKQLSIPTKLCFNTLIKHKLIKKNK